ncbi:hypothetical protein CDL15_Pgr011118 [Punica granatum]|uniref:Uncharacterized protein n=1 Tax=Punica granatum TaxID=22663 RepID=A0A218XN06_PUNGR|nr:hypothetical protein CDL15_Pgr011118 [Punica granatum]PKH93963.1 hypothetical protein CRG98_049797 [Punica granatum]
MGREWRGTGVAEDAWTGVIVSVLWAALLSLALVVAVILSCADGVSKDKASACAHTDTYGTACAAGCGG